MANNREAFERLLTSIPNFDNCEEFSTSRVMEYYQAMEKQHHSELFLHGLLFRRLYGVAKDQITYDRLFLKVKAISRLLDELYELKY